MVSQSMNISSHPELMEKNNHLSTVTRFTSQSSCHRPETAAGKAAESPKGCSRIERSLSTVAQIAAGYRRGCCLCEWLVDDPNPDRQS